MQYNGSLKTTIDIPDEELRDVLKFTKAKTKRAAINVAVAEFNRRKRQSDLVKYFGTCKNLMTIEELMAMRSMD